MGTLAELHEAGFDGSGLHGSGLHGSGGEGQSGSAGAELVSLRPNRGHWTSVLARSTAALDAAMRPAAGHGGRAAAPDPRGGIAAAAAALAGVGGMAVLAILAGMRPDLGFAARVALALSAAAAGIPAVVCFRHAAACFGRTAGALPADAGKAEPPRSRPVGLGRLTRGLLGTGDRTTGEAEVGTAGVPAAPTLRGRMFARRVATAPGDGAAGKPRPIRRRHARIELRDPRTSIATQDGRRLHARVIDVSESGVAIEGNLPGLWIGSMVTVGSRRAKAVRILPRGMAFEFSVPVSPEALTADLKL